MGFWDWFTGRDRGPDTGHGLDELARRLKVNTDELLAFKPSYREFEIPKRSGGMRKILAPDPPLKDLQRRILRRVLGRLRCHPAAVGFERGYSIVSNAVCHTGQAVVVRMDLKKFFDSTHADRVRGYFRKIGWNRQAGDVLVTLCTHKRGLPQGAPTSPRLSNLVNHRMDARLTGLAKRLGAIYSRYADDLTFSFGTDEPEKLHTLIRAVKHIVGDEGYELHQRKKLHIRRRHDRQTVTGLVVNEEVNLPRSTRHWLRAVEHHHRTGRQTTLTEAQLDGWRSLQSMVIRQRDLTKGQ